MTDQLEFPFQRMDAYREAKALAQAVHHAKVRHAELRDQAERAAISVFLQLSEGLPDDRPAMRKRYFTTARNSLCEVVAAIDLAESLAVIAPDAATAIATHAVRVRAMLIALLR
jgi:four helix bundle protein